MLRMKKNLLSVSLGMTMLMSIFSTSLLPKAVFAASAPNWSSILKKSNSWFGSTDGIKLADEIIKYQLADGGWRKGFSSGDGSWVKSTIDNNATTSEIIVLAKTYNQTKSIKYQNSCLKGIELLLNAQYQNGGWPQILTNPDSYHTHITYNDDAMIHVMNLLTAVSNKTGDFTFVDSTRVAKASTAVQKGIKCILNTQITTNGVKGIWCQQHDKDTLKPVSARAYELPSSVTAESVRIINYLKSIPNPSSEITASINSAIAWLKKVKITGIKVVKTSDDVIVVNDSKAEPIWARFYELNTEKAMFVDRDGSVHYALSEISKERRTGYLWYGTWPASLLK